MICWFEIPAFDFDRAVGFYEKVLQTSIEKVGFNGIKHGIFKDSKLGEIGGAIVEFNKEIYKGSGPVLFFPVATGMDIYLERVEAHGGEIIQPKSLIKNITKDGKAKVPLTLIDQKVGYYAYFYDSEGNKMGFYSNT